MVVESSRLGVAAGKEMPDTFVKYKPEGLCLVTRADSCWWEGSLELEPKLSPVSLQTPLPPTHSFPLDAPSQLWIHRPSLTIWIAET